MLIAFLLFTPPKHCSIIICKVEQNYFNYFVFFYYSHGCIFKISFKNQVYKRDKL